MKQIAVASIRGFQKVAEPENSMGHLLCRKCPAIFRRDGLLNIYTVSFFGHRQVENFFDVERRLENLIRSLLLQKEYVEFLVGRNGEFDQLVSSTVHRLKRIADADNSALVLILPYMTAELAHNQESFASYYDEIEVSETAAGRHFKAAIQERNREMIDRSDMVVCYITHESGGAYHSVQYAEKLKKEIINIAEEPTLTYL